MVMGVVVLVSTFALDVDDSDVGVVVDVIDDDDDDGGLFDLIAIGCPFGSLYRLMFAITFDKLVVTAFF